MTSEENGFAGNSSSGRPGEISLEALEAVYDEIYQDEPEEGVLTDQEYRAYRRAGFVSMSRNGKWVIYIDKERLT